MAADLTPKQTNFVARYRAAVVDMLKTGDTLDDLKAEWDANAYATGATPTANNITDAVMLAVAPYATAAQLNAAIAAVEALKSTFAAGRGYLEALRP